MGCVLCVVWLEEGAPTWLQRSGESSIYLSLNNHKGGLGSGMCVTLSGMRQHLSLNGPVLPL